MKALHLSSFGIENLNIQEVEKPQPKANEVLVKFGAFAVNSRDYQIVTGTFAPTQSLPIIPFSDGAGEVVQLGAGATRFRIGDRVAPLFFPDWISGDALGAERDRSSGLEVPGVAREFGAYDENQLAKVAAHLTAEEAACFVCAGLTAWSSLVTFSNIGAGSYVLVQGTGGVAMMALQLARAMDAKVIVTSGSSEKMERAAALGADHLIHIRDTPAWGEAAMEITGGRGVDAVLEVGGTGTLKQSIAAIRRGGHINIIGYLGGIDVGLTVFDLISRNANLHGISVGNRQAFEAMMQFVETHRIRPLIGQSYVFEDAVNALTDLAEGRHFGKLTIRI